MTHRIETGIVIGGEVQPGTAWVLRDSRAWWQPGERGTRPRPVPADVLVGHWTAGRPHEGPDAARRVVRAMKSRRRDDGSPLDVGVHFVISADGMVTQTCDLATATVHVGSRDVNRRSVGVEVCHPGTEAQALRLGGAPRVLPRMIAGRRVMVAAFPEPAVESWCRLADALAALLPIPRRVPVQSAERFQRGAERRWRGAMEHLHVPSTSKIDGAGLLVDALATRGWSRA